MGQSDRVAAPHTHPAASRQIVQRARDYSQTHRVELLQKRGDISWQRAVDERFQKDGLSAVLALVHRDQLAEHGVGALAAWGTSKHHRKTA